MSNKLNEFDNVFKVDFAICEGETVMEAYERIVGYDVEHNCKNCKDWFIKYDDYAICTNEKVASYVSVSDVGEFAPLQDFGCVYWRLK